MWQTEDELFNILDDHGGGMLQAFKRKWKFKLRQYWFKQELAALKNYFGNHQLLDVLQIDPAIYLKCTRSYLWSSLNGQQRAQAQLAFYDWLLTRVSPERICEFYKADHIVICSLPVKEQTIEVLLRPSRGLGREGELAIFLCIDKQVLMKASFTVLPAELLGLKSSGRVMYVGGFQGQRNSLELFKKTTQLMERTKPSVFMLSTLQTLAQVWGLDGIVGSSDMTHAFASYKRTLAKRVVNSYDATWKDLGTESQTQLNHWVLPLTWEPRPEETIESKKRSAYRRRVALRQSFIEACKTGLARF